MFSYNDEVIYFDIFLSKSIMIFLFLYPLCDMIICSYNIKQFTIIRDRYDIKYVVDHQPTMYMGISVCKYL